MLSVDTIARVILNVVRSAAQPTSWDTGLLLVKDSSYTAAKRLRSYASRVALATMTIQDVAGGFTVVCTGVSLQKVPERTFDRTATNLVVALLATTITEQ